MLKNYFKIAIAVLKRRKFFTFISLFGISFTLTILMLTTAFIDKMLSPDYPDFKRNRSLYVSKVERLNTKEGWFNGGSASYYLLDHYVSNMKIPEKIGIYTFSDPVNSFVNDKKIVLELKYTNADYWEIAEYNFIEGKPYRKGQLEASELVAVISEYTKKQYFGDVPSVAGKYIEVDNIRYRVIGVVANIPRTQRHFYGDIYLPYTLSKADYKKVEPMGNFGAVLLARSADELPAMKKEYEQLISKVPTMDEGYDKMYSNADTILEGITRNIFGSGNDSGMAKSMSFVTAVMLLFMLLPAINLININMTRIMERSSEIGVRKAFGASSKTLVYQFVVENVILTLIGGLIALLMSLLGIYIFNESDMLPGLYLEINVRVLLMGVAVCLFFGLLSGVYPAWRMSRVPVVQALKAQ
ncbi:putative permease component of ABC transporter [Pedobacter sp. BAL39]|uniref:ABC transporter permease n=1 Tax=Pedobacter sp. BAL39 TaxID=391596 RepID=UPI00015599A4|nr:ABC transporter permease [Pedobacter sp. BAL39]EDM38310.1 putative permease component of ABC transporter [Pedobacter sp. BAL39]